MGAYLGASEVAAVLGISPFKTSWEVWAKKTGRYAFDEDNEAMEAGRLLEPSVLRWADAKIGVTPCQQGYAVKDSPIVAHPDGIASDGNPVEAKTSGIVGPVIGDWGDPDLEPDGIPDFYYVQCLVQIEATGGTCCYVPTLIGGKGFRMYRVERNEEAQRRIVEFVSHWWKEHVEADKEPPVEPPPPLHVLSKLRREPKSVRRLDEKYCELVDAWLEAKKELKVATDREDYLKRQIIAALNDSEEGHLPDGRVITYYASLRKGYTVPDTVIRTLRIKCRK